MSSACPFTHFAVYHYRKAQSTSMNKAIWKIRVWCVKSGRICLRALFHFDRWHLFSLLEKPYAGDVIRYCNGRSERQSAVEIGCGLGDIIRRLRYRERLGLDRDRSVLRAAQWLGFISKRRRVRFGLFHFPDSLLEGSFDVIILVNWVHQVEPEILRSLLEDYSTRVLRAGGVIILDIVMDPEYRFNHDIRALTQGISGQVSLLGAYERQREVWLIENR
jgi:SAM-dependent methyltransferase